MAQETLTVDAAMQALATELSQHHLRVHQPDDPPLMTPEPQSTVLPHLWRWDTLSRMIGRVSDVVPTGARRRATHAAPGRIPASPTAPPTPCWASIQCILPGEVATAHRHSISAFRFIIDGAGASTTVAGARYPMEAGDLLLTPGWAWHDHRHDGDAPMVWLDGLDIPLARALHAVFFQPYTADQQVVAPPRGRIARRSSAPPACAPSVCRTAGRRRRSRSTSGIRTLAALEALAATGPARPLRRRGIRVFATLDRPLGAAHHRPGHPDAPARRPYRGSPPHEQHGIPRRPRRGDNHRERHAHRVGRTRLPGRAALGLARARQRLGPATGHPLPDERPAHHARARPLPRGRPRRCDRAALTDAASRPATQRKTPPTPMSSGSLSALPAASRKRPRRRAQLREAPPADLAASRRSHGAVQSPRPRGCTGSPPIKRRARNVARCRSGAVELGMATPELVHNPG